MLYDKKKHLGVQYLGQEQIGMGDWTSNLLVNRLNLQHLKSTRARYQTPVAPQ